MTSAIALLTFICILLKTSSTTLLQSILFKDGDEELFALAVSSLCLVILHGLVVLSMRCCMLLNCNTKYQNLIIKMHDVVQSLNVKAKCNLNFGQSILELLIQGISR